MASPIRILLQTTILAPQDDWGIDRFSLLRDCLSSLDGVEVEARNRAVADANDPVLSTIDRSDFDELWLFAVDVGDGITEDECQAISRFRAAGGGLLLTRDHQDLGSSICKLGGVGAAHFFHSKNPDPDRSRHCIDDTYTTAISWPNYHSGANGDYQEIAVVAPLHPLLTADALPEGHIRLFPAHPHEGAVGKPADADEARVIATGKSTTSGREFNLVVVFEGSTEYKGRAVAQSTFHHFADYNWDTRCGAPSFVSEPPGDGMQRVPAALADTHRYVLNVAAWLSRHR